MPSVDERNDPGRGSKLPAEAAPDRAADQEAFEPGGAAAWAAAPPANGKGGVNPDLRRQVFAKFNEFKIQ